MNLQCISTFPNTACINTRCSYDSDKVRTGGDNHELSVGKYIHVTICQSREMLGKVIFLTLSDKPEVHLLESENRKKNLCATVCYSIDSPGLTEEFRSVTLSGTLRLNMKVLHLNKLGGQRLTAEWQSFSSSRKASTPGNPAS